MNYKLKMFKKNAEFSLRFLLNETFYNINVYSIVYGLEGEGKCGS